MSKIGKLSISIPEKVKVVLNGNLLNIEGPLGKKVLNLDLNIFDLNILEGKEVSIKPKVINENTKKLWGMNRSLLNNAIIGASTGYEKTLELSGVGYRAAIKGKVLNLQLGFSHDINFDIPDDLKEISDGVINMGDEVLGALNNIETLLKNNDHELAKKIIKNDLIINDLGQSVENKVFNILASRQPMAIDLRIVFSAVKISLYLERCGDMCKGISNRVLKGDLNEAQSPETISLLVNMCSMVHSNLGIVMEDYSKKECDNSVKVWKSDSEIDSLYSEILMDILNSIKTNPDATDALVPLLFIARYLERVGDQATNVAEETYFVVTGEDLEGLEKTEVENETTF